jgi:hypothetical protein
MRSANRRFELEGSGQCDDQLSLGIRVPSELRIGVGFIERRRDDGKLSTDRVSPRSELEIDKALFEMRLLVGAGP